MSLRVRATFDVWLDSEPTKITNVRITEITDDSVVIEWKTTHLTTSGKVNYGTSTAYNNEILLPSGLANEHRAELVNLDPSTTYYFEIMNQNGDYVFDAYYSITTRAVGEPQLSGLFVPQEATIIQTEDTVDILEKPEPEATVLTVAREGDTFRALTKKGAWISVLLPTGQEGWILEERVELNNQAEVSASAQYSSRP